ncbi:hypothetical protein IQ268_11735 [Oculatella sp. LEGE 06141]|uniref:hypothetical protein n=1 Tax=Oculatella sp. LEGE 06141 TaxID=1828648 RepID=UPI001882C7A6|nr:hypothetical protein [Oculatella sp. LEGE 06141]MBE9179233.1 hypothetical protein [Oculatella sp. LEGE 06141]
MAWLGASVKLQQPIARTYIRIFLIARPLTGIKAGDRSVTTFWLDDSFSRC